MIDEIKNQVKEAYEDSIGKMDDSSWQKSWSYEMTNSDKLLLGKALSALAQIPKEELIEVCEKYLVLHNAAPILGELFKHIDMPAPEVFKHIAEDFSWLIQNNSPHISALSTILDITLSAIGKLPLSQMPRFLQSGDAIEQTLAKVRLEYGA